MGVVSVRWSVLMFGSHNTAAALAAVVFSLKFKRELFRFGLFDVHLGVFLGTLSYEACIDNAL